MTEQDVLKVLAVLKATWPERAILEDTLTAYRWALDDLPPELVRCATERAVRESKFFPAPGELRAFALEDAAALPVAEVAWSEVRRQIAAVGLYGIPRWSSAALEEAVRAIGWRSLCVAGESDLGTLRAQFRDAYQSYRRRWIGGDAHKALEAAAERREALALGPASDYLPEGRPAALRAACTENYAAMGHNAPSTVRARLEFAEKHPGKVAEEHADPLAWLTGLEAWRKLPEHQRERLLKTYGRRPPAEEG